MSFTSTFVGTLGADPELKFGADGKARVVFRIVTKTSYKQDGQWVSSDESWWSVVAFGRLAENIAESLEKGSSVIVSGKAKTRTWETPEGEKRTQTEIVATAVGPNLSWATARVTKNPKDGASDSDPWAHAATGLDTQAGEAPF